MTQYCFDEHLPIVQTDFAEQSVRIDFEYHAFGKLIELLQSQGLGINEFICQTLIDKVTEIEQRLSSPTLQNQINLLQQQIDTLTEQQRACNQQIQELGLQVKASNTLHSKVHSIENYLLDTAREITILSESFAENRITTLKLCEHGILTVDALREIFAHLGIETVYKMPDIEVKGVSNKNV